MNHSVRSFKNFVKERDFGMIMPRILIIWSLILYGLFAQNGSWWEPEYAAVGDTITIYLDPAQNSQIPESTTSLVLHWGVNEFSVGDWQEPPAYLWPDGTVPHGDGKAVRSPMTKANNIWQIRVPTDQTIETLHYVVNTGTPGTPGTYWGKNTGDSNWNITLSQGQITAVFINPVIDNRFGDPRRTPVFMANGDSLNIIGTAGTNNTEVDSLKLFINQEQVYADTSDTLYYTFYAEEFYSGSIELILVATDISESADTANAFILINPTIQDSPLPEGLTDGINYLDEQTVVLSLMAPFKEFIYVIGDFNDWIVDTTYYMRRHEVSVDSVHWWLQIDGLNPGQEYSFQYLVDGNLRIADPYTAKVLDPWHDQEIIDKGLYPDLKPYPMGKTSEPVAIIQTNQPEFNWSHRETFERPEQHELVIYELLIRDFIARHDYSTLIDTLDYLEGLNINAIELMPVNEFEGNSSWGYNPSFYFAPDKYYGPADSLKKFIDACHARDIAVIIDIVLNHTYGQSPMVRLYFEDGKPTSQNPWYNVTSPNPVFSWGYDFNHESSATKTFVDRVNHYWLTEFDVDGFRFDFTKGFTNTPGDGGNYDAARIQILKRMGDQLWAVDSTAYIILEHFAPNDEEKELAEYKHGMMLWGNSNYNYNEATMGYNDNGKSDFSWGFYKTRSWTQPHVVTYMESHDEERLMFKNMQYGNSSGGYDVKNLATALNRMKLASAFFFTLPGPKMLWQFKELGYDVSIDEPCRVCEKPILWNYYQDEKRSKLYKTIAALLKLRKDAAAFRSPDGSVELSLAGPAKRIRISHPSTNAIIVGNFDVVEQTIIPGFFYTGTWYDYFSGEMFLVSDLNDPITLSPGEFHIFTDKPFETPEDDILDTIDDSEITVAKSFQLEQNFPNPFNPETQISFSVANKARVNLVVYDVLGREVIRLVDQEMIPGNYSYVWRGINRHGQNVGSGIYLFRLMAREGNTILFSETHKMILIK